MATPTSTAPPRGCTNFKVRLLSRLLSQHYDAALSQAGLRITQYSFLKVLAELAPLAPGLLARRLGMDPSTLTRNLKPLAASGWVRQIPGKDGRSRLVEITPDGRACLRNAKEHWKAAQVSINERLTEGRVAQLHALVDQCVELLGGDPRSVLPGAGQDPIDAES